MRINPLLDVSDVLNDPDFNEPFKIHRYKDSASWISGKYVVDSTKIEIIEVYGTVIQPSSKDIEQTPQADKTKGQAVFYSTVPLYLTDADGISDKIEWKGNLYRLFNLYDWSSFGYQKVLGVAIEGV